MAAEQRLLSTVTQIVVNQDDTGQIIVRYTPGDDQLPNTILAFIAASIGRLIDMQYIEGDLIILVKNFPDDIGYTLDINGDLILFCDSGDINSYYIDPDSGDLMYIVQST